MSRVFITSDWHLGHKAICKYRPGFDTREQHDQVLVDNYLSIIKRRDTVYFLGDICFTEESIQVIRDLPGHKILIMGNHDAQHFKSVLLHDAFDEVIAMKSYKGVWLTHCPIHETELRGKYNIHGHTHSAIVPDSRYWNVCVEHTGMKPVLFQDLLLKLKMENTDYEAQRLQKLEDRKNGIDTREEM